MTDYTSEAEERREQIFDTLRREILAARLKVTLDEQLHRETSSTVKRLSRMKLPPLSSSHSTKLAHNFAHTSHWGYSSQPGQPAEHVAESAKEAAENVYSSADDAPTTGVKDVAKDEGPFYDRARDHAQGVNPGQSRNYDVY